jgi:SOS-response transcriptional repressor LexA
MKPLNAIQQRVVDYIIAACKAGVVSPTTNEISAALDLPNANGHGSTASHSLDLAVKRGMLERYGKASSRTLYRIPGTDFRTISPEEGRAVVCGSVLAAQRAKLLYKFIARRCRRNGFTPSYTELGRVISETGRTANVGHLLRLLERDGLIERDGPHHSRVYRLPGTKFCTRPLPSAERENPFSTEGWPRPTKDSAKVYDEAVRLRLFALPKHNVFVVQSDTRQHVPKRTEYAGSLVGCTAEMCAL